MGRRKGAAWTCLPCYQCQTGKLFVPSMLSSRNGRLRQLHWQGVAEKGQVHLLPPAMHRMLDAGMQFVPRQRRLPRWTGSGQAPTPPKPPLHPFSNKLQSTSLHPPNHLQTLWPLHHANPATPSMLMDPDAPVRRSSTDQGLSWWGPGASGGWPWNLRSGLRPRHDLTILRPTPNGDFRP